jgi:hypothetical protein
MWLLLWGSGSQAAAPPSDGWLNLWLGAAAIATLAGVVIGGIFTARYGRRASVSLTAAAEPVPGGFLIIARPSVKAVGVFRIKFTKGEEGSQLLVSETYVAADWQPTRVQPVVVKDLFGDTFVEGGEELTTTTMVALPAPPGSVIGWTLWIQVCAPNRFLRLSWLRWVLRRRPIAWVLRWTTVRWMRERTPNWISNRVRRAFNGWQWTDQVFVPLPEGSR